MREDLNVMIVLSEAVTIKNIICVILPGRFTYDKATQAEKKTHDTLAHQWQPP